MTCVQNDENVLQADPFLQTKKNQLRSPPHKKLMKIPESSSGESTREERLKKIKIHDSIAGLWP